MLSPLRTTVPCVPSVFSVTVGVASNESLASTLIVLAVSSFVVALSSAISPTAVIVTVRCPMSLRLPSLSV